MARASASSAYGHDSIWWQIVWYQVGRWLYMPLHLKLAVANYVSHQLIAVQNAEPARCRNRGVQHQGHTLALSQPQEETNHSCSGQAHLVEDTTEQASLSWWNQHGRMTGIYLLAKWKKDWNIPAPMITRQPLPVVWITLPNQHNAISCTTHMSEKCLTGRLTDQQEGGKRPYFLVPKQTANNNSGSLQQESGIARKKWQCIYSSWKKHLSLPSA